MITSQIKILLTKEERTALTNQTGVTDDDLDNLIYEYGRIFADLK